MNPKVDVIKFIDNITAELKKEQVVDESKGEYCKAQFAQVEDKDALKLQVLVHSLCLLQRTQRFRPLAAQVQQIAL